MENPPSILVIDDEPQIRRLLQLTLEGNGFIVQQAATGEEGLLRGGMDRPDLIILDLGLPDMDGMEVLKKLRQMRSIPIMVLSVRSSEQDIVTLLNHGADDYLVKPFRTGELIARVRTALRHRPSKTAERQLKVGPLLIDFDGRTVKKGGETIKLTSTEYALLDLFARNAGKVLTHRYILEQVWGPAYAEETQYSRVYVAQLRKKIEDDPSHPKLIVTESGIGYRFST
jgi:two-component system, OmpR family, KDP operon response regulator KdpE